MQDHPLHSLHWSARFGALQRQGAALLPALLAVAVAVDSGRGRQGWPRAANLGLMLLSLAGAWLPIQSALALHCARSHYRSTGVGMAVNVFASARG